MRMKEGSMEEIEFAVIKNNFGLFFFCAIGSTEYYHYLANFPEQIIGKTTLEITPIEQPKKKVKKKVAHWTNVYVNFVRGGFNSEEDAKKFALDDCLGQKYVEFEYEIEE